MSSDQPVQYGHVKSSYFWDDGSGINGDTGAPASGEPMQKGMAASPSWPLGTEGYVMYNGKKAEFFVGDRGPGAPAESCDVLLDLDGKTFAELTGESWNDSSYTVTGGQGHIDVEYVITKWGDGPGNTGAPHAMGEPSNRCDNAVSPIPDSLKKDDEKEQQKAEAQRKAEEKKAAEQKAAEEAKEKAAQEKQAKETQQVAAAKRNDAKEEGRPSQEFGSHKEVSAKSASNDLSGLSLAGAEFPMAAGALTLAILPAIVVAVIFARRRPAADYAGEGTGGRHRMPSLMTDGMRDAQARLTDAWDRRPHVLTADGLRDAQAKLLEHGRRLLARLRDR